MSSFRRQLDDLAEFQELDNQLHLNGDPPAITIGSGNHVFLRLLCGFSEFPFFSPSVAWFASTITNGNLEAIHRAGTDTLHRTRML